MALVRKALEKVVKGLLHVEVFVRHRADPVHAPRVRERAVALALLRVLRVRHNVAHALARLDPSVALELAVGLDDCVAVHAQYLRKGALARQRAASGQRAADDLRLDLICDLQIDRHLRVLIDLDCHRVFVPFCGGRRQPLRRRKPCPAAAFPVFSHFTTSQGYLYRQFCAPVLSAEYKNGERPSGRSPAFLLELRAEAALRFCS